MIIIAVTVAVILTGVAVSHHLNDTTPPPTTTTQTSSTRPTTSPTPKPAPHPQTVEDPAVVEAIDLTGTVTLGQGWNASDGYPQDDNLEPYVLLTPCGILVTVLWVSYRANNRTNDEDEIVSQKSRMLGYDIATGTLLWSVGLQEMTGLPIPEMGERPPTFTPDCQMVFMVSENPWRYGSIKPPYKNLVIDLHTGKWSLLDMGDWAQCAATGVGWAGCWQIGSDNTVVEPVNLAAPNNPPPWTSMYYTVFFGDDLIGDPVAVGKIWSREGYRDPATGAVIFGGDAPLPEGEREPKVAYVEARYPVGWRSGILIRVETQDTPGIGISTTCQFSIWDPDADQTTWAHTGEIPCTGYGQDTQWTVAGQSLVITSTSLENESDTTITRAYTVADGQMLWERGGDLHSTGWLPMLGLTNYAVNGMSQEYVFFNTAPSSLDLDTAVRINDGAEFRVPDIIRTGADKMMYIVHLVPTDAGSRLGLTGYRAQPSQSESSLTEAWNVVLGDTTDLSILGTFATGGTMYVLTSGKTREEITVSPLVVG